MRQRAQNQQSAPLEMFHNISPQSVIVGAAAAAGAVLAGRWLYNNSDKVTMFLDDITDTISESSGWNQEGNQGLDTGPTSTVKHSGGRVSSNRSSKQNIPVH
jgi:hypothetical protein